MPVYNKHYPDAHNRVGTPDSAARLATEGPTVPVAIGLTPSVISYLRSHGRPIAMPLAGLALIDTGATVCAVDEALIRSLNVPPSGVTTIATPSGVAQHATFPAALSFPGTTLPDVSFADVIGAPLRGQGIVAIIGRNVLRNFVLIYNGPGGMVSLSC